MMKVPSCERTKGRKINMCAKDVQCEPKSPGFTDGK
jgi:hypothetical protein